VSMSDEKPQSFDVFMPELPVLLRRIGLGTADHNTSQTVLAAADELIFRRRVSEPEWNECVAVVADNRRLRQELVRLHNAMARGPITNRVGCKQQIAKVLTAVPEYGVGRVFLSFELTRQTRDQVDAAIKTQLDAVYNHEKPSVRLAREEREAAEYVETQPAGQHDPQREGGEHEAPAAGSADPVAEAPSETVGEGPGRAVEDDHDAARPAGTVGAGE